MIRLWHLDEDENYVLTLFDFNYNNDKIKFIKYENKGIFKIKRKTNGSGYCRRSSCILEK
jgi:hypothetical protein